MLADFEALADTGIGENARTKILHRNVTAIISRLTKTARRETATARDLYEPTAAPLETNYRLPSGL